jgi:predicted small lipoprotein YifL
LLFAAAAIAVSVSACGRRGDLEPPNTRAVQNDGGKHGFEDHRQSQKIKPPKKDFALDPLLQ